jgi:hypothetical protein
MERTESNRGLLSASASYEQELAMQLPPPPPPESNTVTMSPGAARREAEEMRDVPTRLESISAKVSSRQRSLEQGHNGRGASASVDQIIGAESSRVNPAVGPVNGIQPGPAAEYLALPPYQVNFQDLPGQQPPRPPPVGRVAGRGFNSRMGRHSFRKLVDTMRSASGGNPPPQQQPFSGYPLRRRNPEDLINPLRDKSEARKISDDAFVFSRLQSFSARPYKVRETPAASFLSLTDGIECCSGVFGQMISLLAFAH